MIAIDIQLCVADTSGNSLQAGEEAVARNLSTEFAGSSRGHTLMIGRGYPCDGDGANANILGMRKSSIDTVGISNYFK